MNPDARHYRAAWRGLTRQAFAAMAGAGPLGILAQQAGGAAKWVAPTDNPADLAICRAFIATASAFGRQPSRAVRDTLAPALRILAELVGDMLDRTDPAQTERPFRRDIDG